MPYRLGGLLSLETPTDLGGGVEAGGGGGGRGGRGGRRGVVVPSRLLTQLACSECAEVNDSHT